ncbi:MAG: hypothetical protein KJ955_03310 [Nanoarchaeota archaeon]|nr:hypothetical protein [Nanoarchaeota archaeon]
MKLDAKKIKEAENNVSRYLEEGLLKKDAENEQFSGFYMENAKEHIAKLSLERAERFIQEMAKAVGRRK